MSVKLDQAMIEAFISEAFGLDVIHDNDDGAASPQAPAGSKYFELATFQNPIQPVTLGHSSDVTGVLQFILAWPLGVGSIPPKMKAQEVFDAFPAGRRVSFDGQKLVIGSHHRFKAGRNDEKGRYEVIGRINYAAFVSR